MQANLPPRSVAVHIGAHKTATTHLQRTLQAQQNALIDAGVRFYGPESLRRPERGLGDIFGLDIYDAPPKPTRGVAEQMDFMFKDGHRLVFSDENFVGVLHDQNGQISQPLYPRSVQRIAALADALSDAGPLSLFVGLRNPAAFLTSSYCQALTGGRHLSFADYLVMNPLDKIYWPGWIARLRTVTGVGHIHVWTQESYRWRFYDICDAMLGPDVDIRIKPIAERVYAGLSGDAVDHIMTHAPDADIRKISEQARATFPVGDDHRAFAPFDQDQIAAAQVEYDAQLDTIETIADVTVQRA